MYSYLILLVCSHIHSRFCIVSRRCNYCMGNYFGNWFCGTDSSVHSSCYIGNGTTHLNTCTGTETVTFNILNPYMFFILKYLYYFNFSIICCIHYKIILFILHNKPILLIFVKHIISKIKY